jgi:hypothetical protein
VPVTIVLSLLKLVPEISSVVKVIAAIYGILLAMIDWLLFNSLISTYRTNAAKIQELFDCKVYGLSWSNWLIGSKPLPELVNKFARKYKDDPSGPLENWYELDLKGLPVEHAIVVCQKTNLYYDKSLRTMFRTTALFVGIAVLVLLIAIASYSQKGLNDFWVDVLAPFLPVFVLVLKIWIDQSKTIKSAEETHNKLSAVDVKTVTLTDLRGVQDKIFQQRKDGSFVPDFFYRFKRKGLEVEMKENASQH